MSKVIAQLDKLAARVNPKLVRIGYLSEPYDGIGQFALVGLARGSSSAAYVRVPARIYNLNGFLVNSEIWNPLEAGAPVTIAIINGKLQIISF